MKVLRFNAMWCSACLVMKSRFSKIENQLPKEIEIIDYDYDLDSIEVEKWQIGNIIPVYIFLNQNNEEIKRISGEWKEKELLQMILQIYGGCKNEKN